MLTPTKPDYPPLLPPGFSETTTEQLAAVAVQPFPGSIRRPALFDALLVFLELIGQSKLVGELWIDGSFVTSKEEPDDIDVLLVFDPVVLNALSEQEKQHIGYLLDQRRAWESFRLHLFAVSSEQLDDKAYWRGLFCFQHDESTPKGVALIKVNR